MLSRVAEAIYWMSRYLERAEHIARAVEVNWHLSLDLSDAPDAMDGSEGVQWGPLVSATGSFLDYKRRYGPFSKEAVLQFLAFDKEHKSSIVTCLRAARENARTVRDILPPEMWEQINVLHHKVEEMARHPQIFYDNPFYACEDVKLKCILLGGLADTSMAHEEGWHFFRVGRLLERADQLSRLLDVKYFIILPELDSVGGTLDDIQWAALLRSSSAFETYRHRHGRIKPSAVADFMLLSRTFPRSVLYCLRAALESLRAISGHTGASWSNQPERLLGRLSNELEYTSIDEIISQGLHEFVDQLQRRLIQVDVAIYDTFFAIPPSLTTGEEQTNP